MPQRSTRTILILAAVALTALPSLGSPPVRIKDLTDVEGVRQNPLVGYGLVVGLQGTGDGTQAKFTIQSLANLLRRSGIAVPPEQIRVRNVAAVMVTAELPPFVRPGQRIDVQIASMGDAKSLQGGQLLMTPLTGPDGAVYAVAQGAVSLGGAYLGGSGGNSVQKNHPTAGRIAEGALVERAVTFELRAGSPFRLLLRQADFATADRVAAVINEFFAAPVAHAEDATAVRVTPPESLAGDPVGMLARVEALEARPDVSARVAINERTGTVVMGNDVRVSRVALAHGNLSIEVRTQLEASQPSPFAEKGRTVVLPQRDVVATEEPSHVVTLEEGVSVAELVDALNALGVSSRDMIAILQAIQAAGALHAELVLM